MLVNPSVVRVTDDNKDRGDICYISYSIVNRDMYDYNDSIGGGGLDNRIVTQNIHNVLSVPRYKSIPSGPIYP